MQIIEHFNLSLQTLYVHFEKHYGSNKYSQQPNQHQKNKDCLVCFLFHEEHEKEEDKQPDYSKKRTPVSSLASIIQTHFQLYHFSLIAGP